MDGIHSSRTGVGEDGDEHMLLHVKRPGIERELPPAAREEDFGRQYPGKEVAEGNDGDLRRHGGDGERLLAEPEELVDEGEEEAGDGAEEVGSEGEGWERRVVGVGDGEQYLVHDRGS